VLCSSPNSVVIDESVAADGRRAFEVVGAHFLNAEDAGRLAKVLVTPQRLPNPALVGKSAAFIAHKAGITVPEGTRALVVQLAGVGRDHPLSIEKLAPVLSWYVVRDWQEGCERCIEILRYGGMGHTMSIHSQNEDVILQFGLKKPAFRICVNTPTTHGSIGLTTGLDPAMTLGCGGWGGNITSDNIGPRHLLNIKRLAYELRPATAVAADAAVRATGRAERPNTGGGRSGMHAIPAATLAARIDAFLGSRGISPATSTARGAATPRETVPPSPERRADSAAPTVPSMPASPAAAEGPVDFVCEEDVRLALRAGRKLVVGEKTIITPSARELGDAGKVFVEADWPR
jgi:hypothetical protein